ncbi:MAG: HAD family hydrolase [Candidatus Saccharibacteria bacterium]
MKDYSTYLFDWDGTLSKTLDIWVAVLRELFASYDIHPTDKQIGAVLGDWPATLALGVPQQNQQKFRSDAEAKAYQKYLSPELYEGVVPMLARLKQANKKLALITTSKHEAIDIVLAHHELVDLFDLIIAGDDVTAHKPDPEGILCALKHFGTPKDQAVMLGDTDKDLGAARNAAIDSILFYPASHEPLYERQYLQSLEPVRVLSHWDELA